MIEKVATFTVITALAASSAFAQRRDFRKDRGQPAKEEREANRNYGAGKNKQRAYGENIIRVAPVNVLDVGVGFSLGWERLFGRYQAIGLTLPLNLILEDRGNGYFSGSGNGSPSATETYVYFTPGLKVYPFGQRRITYAVGPSLMIGYGGGKEWCFNTALQRGSLVDVRRTRMGIMVSNYVNFNITKSFNLGFEAGFGVRYIDKERLSVPVLYGQHKFSYPISGTGQAALTLGYRF